MASVVSDKFFVQQIFKAFPTSVESNPMASSQYEFDDVVDQFNEETGGFENDGNQFDMSSRQMLANEECRASTQSNGNMMQNHQGAVQAFHEMQRQRAANAFQPQMNGQFQSAMQSFGLGYMNTAAPAGIGMSLIAGTEQTQKNNFGVNQFSSPFHQPNFFYGNLASIEQQQGFFTQQSFNQGNQLWMAAHSAQNQSSTIPQGLAMSTNFQTTLPPSDFMAEFAEPMASTNNIPNEQGNGDLSFQRVLHRNMSGALKGVSGRSGAPSSFNDESFSGSFSQNTSKEMKAPYNMMFSQDNHIESRGILLTKPSDDVADDMPDIARPKRPLTAYNLFFKEERANIVEEQAADNEHHTSDGVKRNRRKEPHGKIGFEAMAKTIAERWKTIDPERLAAYNQRADEGKKHYRKAIAEYNRKRKAAQKKRQQELFEIRSLPNGAASES